MMKQCEYIANDSVIEHDHCHVIDHVTDHYRYVDIDQRRIITFNNNKKTVLILNKPS